MDLNFKGECVIVTGGSSGIGRAICTQFAEHGANVVVCYRGGQARAEKVVEKCRDLGAQAIAVRVNVADEQSVANMVKQAVDAFGRIDILCNNAGITNAMKPIEELTVEEWDEHFNINTKGVFLCSKAVLPYMRRQNYGRILTTSSQCGKTAFKNIGHYCATKAAVILFSQTLALETADQNIRVNCILPGDVNTEMTDHEAVLIAERTGQDVKEVRKSIGAGVPIGHPAEPEEIAKIFVMMASSYADYITGACINATGGELLV